MSNLIDSMKDGVNLVDHTVDPLFLISFCARTCYASHNKDCNRERFIAGIIKSGHESVLENAYVTFYLKNISRVCQNQIVRHRIGCSYCVSGDTVIYSYSKKGVRHTIAELYDMYKNNKSAFNKYIFRSLDENHTIIPNKPIKIFYNGEKSVYEVITESGRKIKTTDNHKFYTEKGYIKLKDLHVGDYVYVNGLEFLENKDWLYHNYIVLNKTRKQIAYEIGCCESLVCRAFKKFHIHKPHSNYPNRKPGRGRKGMFTLEQRKKISLKKRGSNSNFWIKDRSLLSKSGGYYYSNKWLKKERCEFCGSVENLENHHIDKNPINNKKDNIKTLCVSCHKNWHYMGHIGAFKDKIISIKYIGIEPVYDIEMAAPYHNYVANGFVVHNCVESQRYVKMHANAFKMPYKAFSLTEGTLDMVKDCFAFYDRLIANGVPKEDARMFLPMGTTCNMTVTMNFRALRHFLKLRLSKRAQWEVRQIALEMYEICREKWPWLVEDIKYLED